MYFDFVEIGTSDFDTLIAAADQNTIGLSIEPIREYLDRLPSKNFVEKLHAAISDYEGSVDVHHIPSVLIQRYGLPQWLRGCNSIASPHPLAVRELQSRQLPLSLIQIDKVEVFTLQKLLASRGASGLYLLKIDTEGHDCIILDSFFSGELDSKLIPQRLIFETNSAGDQRVIHATIGKLLAIGFDIIQSKTGLDGLNTELIMNNHRRIDKSGFLHHIPGYYIGGYPKDYDPLRPGHENNLSSALAIAGKLAGSGVTLQAGRYEVRNGPYVYPSKEPSIQSWLIL